MEIKFLTDREEFFNDYMDIVRAFYPHITTGDSGRVLFLRLEHIRDLRYKCIIDFDGKLTDSEFCLEKEFLEEEGAACYSIKYNAQLKRHAKIALYVFLSKLTGQRLPYGSLTGIRPTKLYHEAAEKGLNAEKYFCDTLKVTPQKVNLIKSIVKNQEKFYSVADDEIDVFVNIPICTSRCAYCSFISAQLDKVKKFVTPYCDILVAELMSAANIIKERGLKVRSVYVGGGTPTSLDNTNFERVIKACAFDCGEFTVEAGRPDTISREKLDIMSRCGVSRISVNPQTFNQKTLDIIGRSHRVEDIYAIYKTARGYGFDINMDLIAMLPGESLDDFKYSVDCAVALDPENITVHTLALKKGSTLKLDGYDNGEWAIASAMVDYAYESIVAAGYSPYYMYKQKYMSGNLENVGYCKEGKACVYNIDIMEEISSILASGAGAISKRIFPDDRLERLANPKGLDVYLQRQEKIINDKIKFFEQCSK